MKKALSIFALIALARSLNFRVAHAQRGALGSNYGPQRGGWNRPIMGSIRDLCNSNRLVKGTES